MAPSVAAVEAPPHTAGLPLAPAARERLCAFLQERADAVDAGQASVRESLAFLNQELAGVPGVDAACPNADLTRVAATMATAAGCDMSAAFSLWCHRMVLEYLSCAPDGASLREIEVPALMATERLGSTALAAAMAHHVGGAPLPVQWRRTGDDLVLNGRISWASNLTPEGFIMVTAAAHAEDGRPIIVALPGDTPGLEIHPYPRLLALQATWSSSAAIRDLRLPATALVSDDFTSFITRVRPTFLLLQSSFCWGLTQRSLAEARASLRGVNDIFRAELEELETRAAALGRMLHTSTADRGASVPIRDLVRTRLECAQLATAAVALEAKIVGGRGYVTTSGTARRLREAAFLPIQAPTEGQLRWELSRSA